MTRVVARRLASANKEGWPLSRWRPDSIGGGWIRCASSGVYGGEQRGIRRVFFQEWRLGSGKQRNVRLNKGAGGILLLEASSSSPTAGLAILWRLISSRLSIGRFFSGASSSSRLPIASKTSVYILIFVFQNVLKLFASNHGWRWRSARLYVKFLDLG